MIVAIINHQVVLSSSHCANYMCKEDAIKFLSSPCNLHVILPKIFLSLVMGNRATLVPSGG